ncbi:hypothetical protein [Shimia abyssi]|uniref:Frag1/DRAM/Sfk1 family protein n=1 Tax=Shimia abyssi TaxID=1662395 RepID=A0A2P8FAI2_9RHOB|nr:hypothetical protein [Shimia abyssi]PSL18730.1 Frag1/DRAM/Sfk1 family protein [Shimia abyssi]
MTNPAIPSARTALALTIGLASTTFVFVVVNYLIYTVRWEFAVLNPAYMAEQPPTVSRAISDPSIGPSFAMWMVICGPLLVLGLSLQYHSYLGVLKRQDIATKAQVFGLSVLTVLALVFQVMASSGMVILSQFRFPNHNDMHMVGSYLFFFSQAFFTFTTFFVSRAYSKLAAQGGLLSARACRFRARLIWLPAFLSAFYLFLFVAKSYSFGTIDDALYQTYVTVELFLMSSFLIYMMAWAPDSVIAIRRYLASRST